MTRLVSATLLLAIGAAGVTSACSVILAPDQAQCEQDADCAARGFPAGAACTANVCVKPVDPVWGCLGNVVEPVPDPTKKVTLSEQLTDTSQAPVTVATVDVCAKLDVDCTSTDPDYPKGLMPDADGNVTFQVIQGFDGFMRITATGYMDSRVFVGRPIVAQPSVKSVRLLEVSEYSILAGAAKQVPNPMRGTAILYAVDCSGNAAAGVSFTSPDTDSSSQPFYLVNQFPTTPPTATATDVDGFGGIFNMPTGSSVATSLRASDQAFIGQSSFDVLANTISYVQISPTPM